MRKSLRALLIPLLAALAWPPLALAEEGEAPALRFNPFARPLLERAGARRERAGDEPAPQWAAVLTATLVAGSESMANLGGSILRLGDEAHGYRLVEVRLWEAVFVVNGERVVLPVEPRGER